MIRSFICGLFLTAVLLSLTSSGYAANHPKTKPTVTWTAVFSNVAPVKPFISQAYCLLHTPTTVITTIKQITSKNGVNSLNGVNLRYLSYKTEKKDNLYFNIVDAIVSGKNKAGKAWSEPMKLYEQTLAPIAVTYTVWSTPSCKGTFLGTPTVVSS